MTSDDLQSIMPRLSAARNAALFPALSAAMAEFAIESPARAAAFLAQLAHESGQLRFMEEIWGPTPAQLRYEPVTTLATTLGNTQAGDGRLFKGRGPIQITGRANYRRFGDLLGVDLVASPERAAQPDLAFRIAGLYWSKKGLNELADQATPDAFKEITRRINGGFNGLADRQQFYDTARTVLRVAAPAISREAKPAAPPPPAPEPSFERGYEAVMAEAPPAAPRKRARVPRARKPIVRKRTRKAAGTSKRPRKTSPVTRGRQAPARARRTPTRRAGPAAIRRSGRKKPKR